MSDDEDRIATLVRERDLAREECGHEKAMRAGQYEELMWTVRGRMKATAEAGELRTALNLAEERLQLAREALVSTGYFTADEIGEDVAPRITEAWTGTYQPSRGESV